MHSPGHGVRYWVCQCGQGNQPDDKHCARDKAAAPKKAAASSTITSDFALWVVNHYDQLVEEAKGTEQAVYAALNQSMLRGGQ